MKAQDLVGRTFKIIGLETNPENNYLTFILEDSARGTKHKLRISEEGGTGATPDWFTWAEARFDGMTIFQT